MTVYFDTVSPYSYIGVETLLRYRDRVWGEKVRVELVPFFLGGVMKASGNQPPATLPAKAKEKKKENLPLFLFCSLFFVVDFVVGLLFCSLFFFFSLFSFFFFFFLIAAIIKAIYLQGDVARLGKQYKLSMSSPSVFPTNTIKAQRCLAALQLQHRSKELEETARALWRAYWGGGGVDIGSDEGLKQVLSTTLSDAEELMAKAQLPETKKRLENNTQKAVEMGAFGAPWLERKLKECVLCFVCVLFCLCLF